MGKRIISSRRIPIYDTDDRGNFILDENGNRILKNYRYEIEKGYSYKTYTCSVTPHIDDIPDGDPNKIFNTLGYYFAEWKCDLKEEQDRVEYLHQRYIALEHFYNISRYKYVGKILDDIEHQVNIAKRDWENLQKKHKENKKKFRNDSSEMVKRYGEDIEKIYKAIKAYKELDEKLDKAEKEVAKELEEAHNSAE